MRTSDVGFVSVCVLTLGFFTPALGFDGTTSESGVAPAVSVDMVSRGNVTNAPLNVPAPALAAPSQNIVVPNPVLGVTGNGQDFDVATFLASGANTVLTRHRQRSGGALLVSDALLFPLSTIRCSPSRWT